MESGGDHTTNTWIYTLGTGRGPSEKNHQLSSIYSHSFNMSCFTLCKDSRKLKLKEEQLNLRHIGQIFGLFPGSILLIADDGTVETPDKRGEFSLQTFLRYQVHGEPLLPKNTPQSTKLPSCGTTVATTSTRTPKGISIKTKWPAKPPGVAAKNIEWTKGIEVYHFLNGDLKKISNFPILLTEATASIGHMSEQLSFEVFSGKKVLLLDNDNYQFQKHRLHEVSLFFEIMSIMG